MKTRIGDKMDDKPPNRVFNLVDCYYPHVCHTIAPVNVYRVLFWVKAEEKRVFSSRSSDTSHYVRHLDILADVHSG